MRWSEMHTPNGHKNGEVASALQKSIRRGLERESLYWASELDMAGYGGYAFKRLRVIASEDVGMADPIATVIVRTLYENWLEARKGKVKPGDPEPHTEDEWVPGTRLFLLHAVLVLVRAPKSRMVDHAVMAFYEGDRPPLEMPDWALDQHTAAGRKKGRGLQHFFDEGAVIVGETIPDPWAAEGREAREHPRPKRSRRAGGDEPQLRIA